MLAGQGWALVAPPPWRQFGASRCWQVVNPTIPGRSVIVVPETSIPRAPNYVAERAAPPLLVAAGTFQVRHHLVWLAAPTVGTCQLRHVPLHCITVQSGYGISHVDALFEEMAGF